MKLFKTWSRAQIVEAIQFLETNLANGVQSATTTEQGTISYSSPDNAFRILRSLYARLDEFDGTKSSAVRPRVILQRITGGSL
ncbi:hypothetical protein ABIA16_003557 [Sinorhizobium fredii]